MAVCILPVSSLCLAYTDFRCKLYRLCFGIVFLCRHRVSTPATGPFFLALLVLWLGSAIHFLEGCTQGKSLLLKKRSKKRRKQMKDLNSAEGPLSFWLCWSSDWRFLHVSSITLPRKVLSRQEQW